MPDHLKLYQTEAAKYDLLVSHTDYKKNLVTAINHICPLDGLEVVEFGAGTGRQTCWLAPMVKTIYAFDQSQHMLDVANKKLEQTGLTNWHTAVGEHQQIDFPSEMADLAIAAWTICYLVERNNDGWKTTVPKAVAEMQRVVRPGGTLIIIETLGSGFDTPTPPPHLIPYYKYLESQGFQHKSIHTDCLFKNVEEAKELLTFFFNDNEIDKRIQVSPDGVILPECTGIWWRK